MNAGNVIGRCYACGRPVRVGEATWTKDFGVLIKRGDKQVPVTRVAHEGTCAAKVETQVMRRYR